MYGVTKEQKDLLGKLTNWQFNQAMKECKGNIRDLSTDRLQYWFNCKKDYHGR